MSKAAGLAFAALTLAGAGYVAFEIRRRDNLSKAKSHGKSQEKSAATPTPAAPSGQSDDPIVAPAYPYLDQWTTDARRALFDLQKELGLDSRVGGLAGVIGHESHGDPSVPTSRSGTPRGGLIQVTVGANLPGYTTADAVWNIRNQDRVAQLKGVVRDFYKRQMPNGPPKDQGAAALLRRNYLPGLAGKSSSFVLGVKHGSVGPGGEKPEDSLAGKLTLGGNYAANPGFDRVGRGWFTWEDVDSGAAKAERDAIARGWIRASGARVQPGDPPIAGAQGSFTDGSPEAVVADLWT
jgi:hypothetical protein